MPPVDENADIFDSTPSATGGENASTDVGTETAAPEGVVAEGSEGSESSTEQGATSTHEKLLQVVRDVTEQRKEPEQASPAEGRTEPETATEGQQPQQDDEKYTDVPFHKHPRFQKLLGERNTFKVDAERYGNVQKFLNEHGVPAEQAADALLITALVRTDPQEAWKRLEPIVKDLLERTGELLPSDLAQEVKEGRMTLDAARQVAKANARVSSLEERQKFDAERAQQNAVTEKIVACRNAAASWEADRTTKDPNFAAKLEPLMDRVAYLQKTEGEPDTPQGVQAQLDKAYAYVNQRAAPAAAVIPRAPNGQYAPARRAVAPITGGQVAGTTHAKPKGVADIIDRVLERRGA